MDFPKRNLLLRQVFQQQARFRWHLALSERKQVVGDIYANNNSKLGRVKQNFEHKAGLAKQRGNFLKRMEDQLA
jgi:hypothetical protein